MKETPIIFTTESVKAILDGRKSQTRRVIKPQPLQPHPLNMISWKGQSYECWKSILWRCPYGKVGDKLWVRETFCYECDCFAIKPRIRYKAGGIREAKPEDIPIGATVYNFLSEKYPECINWRPSIFMPCWASRITLEITEVRVERLQEITDKDCIAEGCPGVLVTLATVPMQAWFRHLWDSINAKRGYGWEVNPWVWVISFATGVRLK